LRIRAGDHPEKGCDNVRKVANYLTRLEHAWTDRLRLQRLKYLAANKTGAPHYEPNLFASGKGNSVIHIYGRNRGPGIMLWNGTTRRPTLGRGRLWGLSWTKLGQAPKCPCTSLRSASLTTNVLLEGCEDEEIAIPAFQRVRYNERDGRKMLGYNSNSTVLPRCHCRT
jgi:hypothetical protein